MCVENFKLYDADPKCKHIFFAAADCPKYVQLLQAYGERREAVTLVRGSISDYEMEKLGLRALLFKDVFRAAPTTAGNHVLRGGATAWVAADTVAVGQASQQQ